MKHVLIFLTVIGLAALLQSNLLLIDPAESNEYQVSKMDMPENIKAIVDNSCYGCHNTESRNEKGKEKFKFDVLDDLSKAKQVAALEAVIEVMKEDAMPPKKFKEKYPDNVPSKDDSKKLIEWADSQAEKILGN